MSEYNDYSEYPSMNLQWDRKAARLIGSSGKVIGYINNDGSHSFVSGREHDKIVAWDSFGITDAADIVKLEAAVDNLINRLAQQNGSS